MPHLSQRRAILFDLFVGDHPHNDMLGAAGAGLTPIWLRGIRLWPDALPEPEWQIDTLGDLLRLVEASAR